MTNEELIAEIKAGRDKADNLLQLYIQNRNFIYRWCKPMSATIDMADLMQESFLALHDAIAAYDGDREDGSFLSCLRFMMLKHFRDLQRSFSDITTPGYLSYAVSQYKKMRDAYRMTLGKEPSEQVYCQVLRISYKELATIRANLNNRKVRSLSEPVINLDGEDITLEEMLAVNDPELDRALDDLEREELKQILDDMIDGLSEKQARIIRLRYNEGYTLKQCGEFFGVTAEGARKIEEQALRKMRKQSDNMMLLREFIPDTVVYDFGMIRRGLSSFRTTLESTTETAAFNLMRYREKLSEKTTEHNRHIDELSSFFRSDGRMTASN